MPERAQFMNELVCAKCGTHGHATWEESGRAFQQKGPETALIELSGDFIANAAALPGVIQIICKNCGTIQPG